MTNCVVKNSTKKPILIRIKRDTKQEDYTLDPKTSKEMPKLAGSTVEFFTECDLTLRQKKIVPGGFALLAKVVKSKHIKVKELQLPDIFTVLKIKKTY